MSSTGKKKPTRRPLQTRDILRLKTISDPQLAPDGSRVAWVQTQPLADENRYSSRLMVTELETGRTRELTVGAGTATHPRWSPDGKHLAYLYAEAAPTGPKEYRGGRSPGAQLHLMPAEGGESRQLTEVRHGVAEPTWSPCGGWLAFSTLVDPSCGLEAALNGASSEPEENDDLYERFTADVRTVTRLRWRHDGFGYFEGLRSHIGIVGANTSSNERAQGPRLLTQGDYDLNGPSWSPGGDMLAVCGSMDPSEEAGRTTSIYVLEEVLTEVEVEARKVFTIETFSSMLASGIRLDWSPDGDYLAVYGHRDPVLGHYANQQVWCVPVDAEREAAPESLTRTLDISFGDASRDADLRGYGGNDGPQWKPDGDGLWVLLNEEGTTHLAQLKEDTGRELTRLTQGEQVVNAFSVDASGSRMVLLMATGTNPCDLYWAELDEEDSQQPLKLNRLTAVNGEFFEEVLVSPPERFTFDSDGKEIVAWLVPPVKQDANKVSPLLVYNGGGPGGMRTGMFSFQSQALAASGYAVLHCNARGNLGHGEEFSRIIRGRWGEEDYHDNMRAVEAVCERFDCVDGELLGAFGNSYGGYMTNWMISHEDCFDAAVSMNCLFNRFSFNGTGDIAYLLDSVEFDGKLPWEAPADWLERSPLKHIGEAATPTLVIQSTEDYRCPRDQGEQLYMALRRMGVPTKLVLFENEGHGIRAPWHRVHRLDLIIEWFSEWLR
jgi:dipeptidyl aminopeptidase/acylaminoacyl peptidase